MNKCFPVFWVILWFVIFSCDAPKNESIPIKPLPISEADLHDRILGMLVGSAIGDAMGAPTEMWPREEIIDKYGFVTGLDSVIRNVSPEGVWRENLPPGGTTDDTRWKNLMVAYLVEEIEGKVSGIGLSKKILRQYEQDHSKLTPNDSLDSISLVKKTLPLLWLHEWKKVAEPLVSGDLTAYNEKLSSFYGGEMVCGGLLYGPVLGAFYPGDPELAYSKAFELAAFDIGYARDITALSAAWTSLSIAGEVGLDSMSTLIQSLDPKDYSRARLVGRTANRILSLAHEIAASTKETYRLKANLDSTALSFDWNEGNLQPAFALLDQHLQDMPFHAGEIYLQVLTAMFVADFDFEKAMQFLVNYGRDNDTTAAIAGAILGAKTGFNDLPPGMKAQVIKVNKEHLGIDLEEMAKQMHEKILARYQ